MHMCVLVTVCLRVCVLCYCKGNDRAEYYFPSTTSRPHIFECINSMAIANASPMPITFLWIAKMVRKSERGGGGGGPGVRVQGGYSSLFVAPCLLKKKKKNLKCSYVHWKASARWILKYLWHQCFFFFLLCVYKLQAVTQLFPWQYLSVWGIH